MGDFDINQIQQSVAEGQKPKEKSDIKRLLTRLAILLLVLVIGGGIYVVYSLKYANDPDRLTIGYNTEETFVLITLARQKNLFEEKGVTIDYRKFKTDQDVLEALNEDKIDLAVVEDIEFVMTLPPQRSQKIIASISSADSYFYLLDIQKGLLALEDLTDRSLGTVEAAGNNYWLEDSFSARNEIEIRRFKPSKLAKEFAYAKVDSVLAKQPLVYETENFAKTQAQALRISAQGEKDSNTIMVVNEEFVSSDKEVLQNFLRVLYETESFYVNQFEDAKEILLAQWNVEQSYLNEILRDYKYELVLNVKLKNELSAQYDWKSRKSRNSSQSEFVLENVFYYPLLREVKPEGVEF